jgi:hypothetical protein
MLGALLLVSQVLATERAEASGVVVASPIPTPAAGKVQFQDFHFSKRAD